MLSLFVFGFCCTTFLGQRKGEFSDTQASTNASAMEHFWYTLNGYGTIPHHHFVNSRTLMGCHRLCNEKIRSIQSENL